MLPMSQLAAARGGIIGVVPDMFGPGCGNPAVATGMSD